MNAAHVHLMLNHLPLSASLAGLLLLGAARLRPRENRDLEKAGLIALIVGALVAIPTYLTGEGAEDIVKRLPGVAKALVEPHEEAAIYALVAIELAGVVALAASLLARSRPPQSRQLTSAALALAALSLATMGRVAYLGGQIHHAELRSDAATSEPESEQPSPSRTHP
jgi:uncharacterized membrane protein